jgi:acyl carrier protein
MPGMPVTLEAVQKSVKQAIAEYNAGEERPVPDTPSTVLLGPAGAVDSLGLVRLVLAVERQVADDFGVAVSLTDERAMSQRNSPFRSVGSLSDYVVECLNHAG